MELSRRSLFVTQNHKYRVVVIFLYSLIIDALWFIFIYMLIINTDDYYALADFERGIQKCSHVVMWINVGVKVLVCLTSGRRHRAVVRVRP